MGARAVLRILLLLAVAVATLPALGARDARGCTLRVGWEPWEPYAYRAKDGAVTGLDAEAAKLVIAAAGCKPSFVEEPWHRLLRSAEEGSVDILPTASRTPEREAFGDFGLPYRMEEVRLVGRAGEMPAPVAAPLRPLLLERGRKLGVVRGYAYGPEVAALLADPALSGRIETASSDDMNFGKLLARRIDFLLTDRAVAAAMVRRPEANGALRQHQPPIYAAPIYFMTARKTVSVDRRAALDDAVRQLLAGGKLAALEETFLGPGS